MTQITEYFSHDDIDSKEAWEKRAASVTKSFEGVEVKHTYNTSTGTFLTFDGLNINDGHLCLSVDGDKINEVAHLILRGNKAIGEGK